MEIGRLGDDHRPGRVAAVKVFLSAVVFGITLELAENFAERSRCFGSWLIVRVFRLYHSCKDVAGRMKVVGPYRTD